MRDTLLNHLVAPGTEDSLELADVVRDAAGDIVEATLAAPDGRRFPVRNGIPRFVEHTDTGQAQTENSFGYKWGQAEAFASDETQAWARGWLVERYGFADAAELRSYFASRRLVMDAGCGNAYTARLWLEPGWTQGAPVEWIGVDISTAVDVAMQRLAGIEGLHFVQADLLDLPFRAGAFDTAFSEGVLHHTPSTERALRSVVNVVEPGGEVLAYVYRRKGPIREFTDDYLRDQLAPLDPEEARARLRPLTSLARSLSAAGATVTVPDDIPELGITAGDYDLQRFVYWHIAKLFWNDLFEFEDNNLVNFDWYHPRYAHRHTEADLRGWFEELGLELIRLDTQDSGFTFRVLRTGSPSGDAGERAAEALA